MQRVITSIRIDIDVKEFSKIAAMRENFTFTAYYENLLLFNLKENHPELYKEYLERSPDGVPVEKIKRKSKLMQKMLAGEEIRDSVGSVIVPAKSGEELEEYHREMKKKGLL